MVRYVIRFHKVCYSTFVQQDNYREHNLEVELDPFTNIKLRIQEDNKSIRNVCAKYLDSKHPWLPIKPKPTVQYYFLDKTKKLGWCVNAKVLIFSYMFINANLIIMRNIGQKCKNVDFLYTLGCIINCEISSDVCFKQVR